MQCNTIISNANENVARSPLPNKKKPSFLTVSNKVQHIIFLDISSIDSYFMISKGLVYKNFFENGMSSLTNPELHGVSTTS